ncbi:MAG TPA: discoidin domain-containing protein [Polyangia bacterium]|nr:discoidin domain-containing protein [Polyangia bacterium]
MTAANPRGVARAWALARPRGFLVALLVAVLSSACQQPEGEVSRIGGGADALAGTVSNDGAGDTADVAVPTDGANGDSTAVAAEGGSSSSDGGDGGAVIVEAGDVAPLDALATADTTADVDPIEMVPVGPCGAGSSVLAPMGWRATASRSSPGDVPEKVFDGNPASRWSTGINGAPGHSFRLDLSTSRTVDGVLMETGGGAFATDFPRGFSVALSTDDANYAQVATGTGTDTLTVVHFPARAARYIKIALTSASPHWWGIAELTVCTQ